MLVIEQDGKKGKERANRCRVNNSRSTARDTYASCRY